MASAPAKRLVFAACTIGDVAAVKQLLKSEGDEIAVSTNENGSTPLHASVYGGFQRLAEVLLEAGAPLEAREDPELGGHTPLHAAVMQGDYDLCELLVEWGADVMAAETDTHLTPLHMSARLGHNDIARLLLANGADPNRTDESGFNAAKWAELSQNDDFLLLPGVGEPVTRSLEERVLDGIRHERAVRAMGLPAIAPKKKKGKKGKKSKPAEAADEPPPLAPLAAEAAAAAAAAPADTA